MQPIIRDSEDEDEEELFVPNEHAISKPSQQSTNSWMIAEADAILAENPSQGLDDMNEAVDQSSLSTGKSRLGRSHSVADILEVTCNGRSLMLAAASSTQPLQIRPQ